MVPSAIFSNSQSLRAIGQSLEFLSISSFEVERQRDNFRVRIAGDETANEKQRGRKFFDLIADVVWGACDFDTLPRQAGRLMGPLDYGSADIIRLDTQGALRRGNVNAFTDNRTLSQALRLVGDYLDRKKARAYTVSMAGQSLSLIYQTSKGDESRETFNSENLYKREICLSRLRARKARHAT